MRVFATAHSAAVPRSKHASYVAIGYAAVLTLLAVAQLYTFEEFPAVISAFGLPGGEVFAHFLAAFLVVAEVFTLPFLLRMKLSDAMRWFSMFLGWLVAALWLFISLWIVLTLGSVANGGFLGALIELEAGWWMVWISLAFGIMATWAAWGMWPHKLRKP